MVICLIFNIVHRKETCIQSPHPDGTTMPLSLVVDAITTERQKQYPTGRKFSLKFKFCNFANGKFDKFEFRLLLYS